MNTVEVASYLQRVFVYCGPQSTGEASLLTEGIFPRTNLAMKCTQFAGLFLEYNQ